MPSASASSSSPAPWPSVTPLIAALSRATSMATASMSVAMHFASGHSASAAKASRPVPVPMSAMLAKRAPSRSQPVERFEAAAGRRVLAGAEGEAGVDLERDRARAGRFGTSACGRRSGRRGSAGGRPGSSSPSPLRQAARSAARPMPSRRSSASSSRARRMLEIGVDQPVVGPGSDRARRRRARADPLIAGTARRPARPPRPARGCRATVTRQLTSPRLPSPAARRGSWSARAA